MIELLNVNKTYHLSDHTVNALHDISFNVNAGDIFGVIGKSGAGKSTLLRCINLLERPTSGQVFIDGLALTQLNKKQLREERRRIAMIFQQFNLVSALSVYENVALPLRLQHLTFSQIQKRVMPLLELVGLSDKANVFPAQLSGGQKQRVAIARALAIQPKVLLCDEATSSLDPHNTEAILDLLQKVHDEFHLTIVLITHEMAVVKQICDNVLVLDQGSLVEKNSLASIFTAPQSDVTKQFVSSVLHDTLPKKLEDSLSLSHIENSVPLWRIYFKGVRATEPIMTDLSQQFGLSLNILQANLEYVADYTIGIMIVAVQNADKDFTAAFQYLLDKGLVVETIGYVARDLI